MTKQYLRAKWEACCKKPTKLLDMFTGYHASRNMVSSVLSRAGVNPGDIGASNLASWSEERIHGLVAHFLAVRFPILIALNKADLEGAEEHIAKVAASTPYG